MAIVMDMSSYKIESDHSIEAEYGEEVAYAGWNPALTLAHHQATPADKHSAMPAELANADVEKFLQKMYALMR